MAGVPHQKSEFCRNSIISKVESLSLQLGPQLIHLSILLSGILLCSWQSWRHLLVLGSLNVQCAKHQTWQLEVVYKWDPGPKKKCYLVLCRSRTPTKKRPFGAGQSKSHLLQIGPSNPKLLTKKQQKTLPFFLPKAPHSISPPSARPRVPPSRPPAPNLETTSPRCPRPAADAPTQRDAWHVPPTRHHALLGPAERWRRSCYGRPRQGRCDPTCWWINIVGHWASHLWLKKGSKTLKTNPFESLRNGKEMMNEAFNLDSHESFAFSYL